MGENCAKHVGVRLLAVGAAVCLAVWVAAAAFAHEPEELTVSEGPVQPIGDGYVLKELAGDVDNAVLEALLWPEDPADETADEPVAVAEPEAEPEAVAAADPAERVLALVNQHRAAYGRAALTLNASLCSAAAIRAGETTSHFSHVRPDGSQWYTVSSLAHGENIVMGTGMDADRAMEKWMNSPPHRESILDGSYATLGVGWCQSGSEVYWVQLFGY